MWNLPSPVFIFANSFNVSHNKAGNFPKMNILSRSDRLNCKIVCQILISFICWGTILRSPRHPRHSHRYFAESTLTLLSPCFLFTGSGASSGEAQKHADEASSACVTSDGVHRCTVASAKLKPLFQQNGQRTNKRSGIRMRAVRDYSCPRTQLILCCGKTQCGIYRHLSGGGDQHGH